MADYTKISSFTWRGPGLDVSCTVDHNILGLSFLSCTQTIPEKKEDIIIYIFKKNLVSIWASSKSVPMCILLLLCYICLFLKILFLVVVTCFYSSGSSVCSWTTVPRDKSHTCKSTRATTWTMYISGHTSVYMMNWITNWSTSHTSFCRWMIDGLPYSF